MIVRKEPVYVRRRRVAALVLVVVLTLLAYGLGRLAGTSAATATPQQTQHRSTPTTSATSRATATHSTATSSASSHPTTSPSLTGVPGPSDRTTMVRVARLTGGLTSKSVVASKQGQVFAQNMMYSHTISVFAPDGTLRRTIADGVDLAKYGVAGHPGTSKGAPVEMAFSPDGKTAWVSNYAMYGRNFSPEGRDACTSAKGISDSYVYRIDTTSYAIERVVRVGAVPKYVAVTPDGSKVLVTNWCSMDLSVIDARTAKVVATVPLQGAHPRGIAVSPDSHVAYVAIMGSDKVMRVDLRTDAARPFAHTGEGPRHVVISPDGRTIYVTNNGSGTVSAVDAKTGTVKRSVKVGHEPRSMALSSDGRALYVVNYDDATVDKLRTSDLTVVQQVRTDAHPIGITYEPTRKTVWVACYGGSILLFDDSRVRSA